MRGNKGRICAHVWGKDKATVAALRVRFQGSKEGRVVAQGTSRARGWWRQQVISRTDLRNMREVRDDPQRDLGKRTWYGRAFL